MNEIATLVALPPAPLSEALTQLSAAIGDLVESDVVLCDSMLPHLTVVQWRTDHSDKLLKRLAQMTVTAGELVLAGLCLLPGSDGEIWIEVPVLSAKWLRRLQLDAMAAGGDLGEVVSGVGERYRPHVTVGLTHSEINGNLPLPFPALRAVSGEWTLGVGVSGANYTLPRVIYNLESPGVAPAASP